MSTNPIDTTRPEDGNQNWHAGEAQGAWEAPYLVILLIVTMATLPFLPRILQGDDVLKKESIGRLQQVHYVGGIWIKTQISVAKPEEGLLPPQWRSYLLQGVAQLPAQSELEMRYSANATQVCIQHTAQCWPLYGN